MATSFPTVAELQQLQADISEFSESLTSLQNAVASASADKTAAEAARVAAGESADAANAERIAAEAAKTAMFSELADPSAGKGSELVAFQRRELGGSSRAVSDRLADYTSVKDFGAYGGGLTDESSGIQAALNSGAKRIYLPAGTYLASGLTIPPGVTVFGDGKDTLLKDSISAVSRSMFTLAGGGVCIKDMIVEGGQGESTTTYFAGNTAIVNVNDGNDFDGIDIRNVEIRGWGDGGILLYRPLNSTVEGCHIHDVGRFGVFYFGGFNSHIRFNTIKNIAPGSGGNAPFINAYGLSFTCNISEAGFPRPENCSAVGNHIENVPTWEGIDIHGGKSILISGNTVINCMIGCFVGPSTGTNNQMCDDVTVSGNTFKTETTYRRAAIIVAPTHSVGSAWGYGFVITGNRITGHGANQNSYNSGFTSLEGAIHIVGCRGVTVSGNYINLFNTAAVYVRQYTEACEVSANTIIDGVATNSLVWALLVEQPSTTVVSFSSNFVQRVLSTETNGLNILGGGGGTTYGVRFADDNKFVNLTLDYEASARGRLHRRSGDLLVPKAWAYVTNNGTTAAIQDGAGIQSASRNSAGSVALTFTFQPPVSTYGVVVTARGGSPRFASVSNTTTSGFDVFTWTSNTAALADSGFYVAVYW